MSLGKGKQRAKAAELGWSQVAQGLQAIVRSLVFVPTTAVWNMDQEGTEEEGGDRVGSRVEGGDLHQGVDMVGSGGTGEWSRWGHWQGLLMDWLLEEDGEGRGVLENDY